MGFDCDKVKKGECHLDYHNKLILLFLFFIGRINQELEFGIISLTGRKRNISREIKVRKIVETLNLRDNFFLEICQILDFWKNFVDIFKLIKIKHYHRF